MRKHLEELVQKEMSRKEFLATMGLGMASVFGMSTIISLLSDKSLTNQHRTNGYGSGPYGGHKKQAAANLVKRV